MKITPSTNTTQRINIITMVEPFASPAAWLCRFQPPHPRVPLQKGLDKGGAKGSYLLLQSGGEKKLLLVVSHLDMYCTKVLMYRTMVLMARPTKVRC